GDTSSSVHNIYISLSKAEMDPAVRIPLPSRNDNDSVPMLVASSLDLICVSRS
ncbi:hypothetical protein AcV5_002959, partial [Taiwanofungus camphoratus]